MTGPLDLYRFAALLLPWTARGLSTFGMSGTTWHDGDTFNALVDQGMRHYGLYHVRCAGYNAAELHSPTTVRGEADAEFARSLVESGQIVYLNCLAFVPQSETDDFGRMLGYVTLPDGRDLSPTMITAGHGKVDDPESQVRRFLQGRTRH